MHRGRRTFVSGAAAVVALALVAVPRRARADEVSVEVNLGTTAVHTGEGVLVEVVVRMSGGAPEVSEPRFPEHEGMTIEPRGTVSGTSITNIGGRVHRERTLTFEYVAIPNNPGEFTFAVEIEVSGTTYTPATAPTLSVTGPGLGAEPVPVDAGSRPTEADGDVFLWPVVDKREVYVGEPLSYRFEVWVRGNDEVAMRVMPTFKDFWTEELPPAKVRRESVRGVRYRVHPSLCRVLFPQRAGTLEIGGGEVIVSAGGLSLFRPRRAPETVVGPPVQIEVKPLPASGQPQGFPPNNVGRFAIAARADRSKIEKGDAVALVVEISGTGNLRLVTPDAWPEIPGFRRYEPNAKDPEITVEGGEPKGRRSFEFLLVAERSGTLTIPAFTVAYFDPAAGAYERVSTDPITIEVGGSVDVEEGSGEPATGPDGEGELLTDVIAADELDRKVDRVPWLGFERWAAAMVGVPAVLGLGAVVARIIDRRTPDAAAREQARRAARRSTLLAQARGSASTGEGFHLALGELLHAAVVDRLGASAHGLPNERLLDRLGEAGVSEVVCSGLRELLDACDAARFGAGTADRAIREEQLARALALLGDGGFEL